MARAYSNDLRERVASRVLSGFSCRETAALFGVSVASAVKWSQRLRTSGSAAALPMGNRRPLALARERDWILARLSAVPDLTLRALVVELRERGIATSYGSVQRLVHREGLSFKKNTVRHRTGSPGRGKEAAALAVASGKDRSPASGLH